MPEKSMTPQDVICRITGCGMTHADRVVREIGKDAANAVLEAAESPEGDARVALRDGYSKSTVPSAHVMYNDAPPLPDETIEDVPSDS